MKDMGRSVDMVDVSELFPYLLDVEAFLCEDLFVANVMSWSRKDKLH